MTLTWGLPASELARLSACLDKLLPHVRDCEIAITGGVAIQRGVALAGGKGSRVAVADLDLVASRHDAVAPSVAEAFLISHYHVVQPGVPKFMVQLVDPEWRVRVDIFPDLVGSLARATRIPIGAHRVNVLALEDIFEHKLLTLSKASPAGPVDPKHAADAELLGNLLRRAVPAVSAALVEDVYGIDAALLCRRCELSADSRFPLAPKERIFELLGWTKPPAAVAAP
ncbi:MAG TPA: hypothetical protein VE907_07310 [Gammaproteobacteria bacterium]|nr:hypothetical protein [Gammaproteobacteria bacterium]